MGNRSALVVRRGTSVAVDPVEAARELHRAIYQSDAAVHVFYCSASLDLPALGAALAAEFGGAHLVGCTTAGEIGPQGYADGTLTGWSISGAESRASSVLIDDLSHFTLMAGDVAAQALIVKGSESDRPSGANAFTLLLVDGLSLQEEVLTASISRNLGDIPLVGGSAGDGTRFRETFVYYEGRFRRDAAVATLVRTEAPFVAFKTEHFEASDGKLVVTEAQPDLRIVREINGRRAAREYARVLGMSIDKLSPFVFAAHPVVVRLGGSLYVRSIQKVNEDESLTFFCAIDEGIVLTVARGVDMRSNLVAAFEGVQRRIGVPELTIGCDCILRRLEMEESGFREDVARLLQDNHVVGFATYGEQFNGMHVNQTFAGIALGRLGS